MFDDIEKIEGPEPQQQPNHNSWKYMNWIQRTGVIGCSVLFLVSFPLSSGNEKPAIIIGVCAWSCMLFGYVAGALWKVKHALHFWYSMAFACLIHASLLPIYSRLTREIFESAAGRGYIYLTGFLVAAETIVLVFVLKRVAMRLHGKHTTAEKGPLAGFNYGE